MGQDHGARRVAGAAGDQPRPDYLHGRWQLRFAGDDARESVRRADDCGVGVELYYARGEADGFERERDERARAGAGECAAVGFGADSAAVRVVWVDAAGVGEAADGYADDSGDGDRVGVDADAVAAGKVRNVSGAVDFWRSLLRVAAPLFLCAERKRLSL